MKRKVKKLQLNKETLVNMGDERLQEALGGLTRFNCATFGLCGTNISYCYQCITYENTDCCTEA